MHSTTLLSYIECPVIITVMIFWESSVVVTIPRGDS